MNIHNILPRELQGHETEYTIVDVRELDELEHGTIPTTISIPMHELTKAIQHNALDQVRITKEKPVVTVCRTGARSAVAAALLMRAGITAHNLQGGMNAWSEIDPRVEKY